MPPSKAAVSSSTTRAPAFGAMQHCQWPADPKLSMGWGEMYLSNTYAELNISSRRELAAALQSVRKGDSRAPGAAPQIVPAAKREACLNPIAGAWMVDPDVPPLDEHEH
jgi:hypothetical protein